MARSGEAMFRLMKNLYMLLPTAVFYYSSFTRKFVYRTSALLLFCSAFGYFRQPYVMRNILRNAESSKQREEDTVTEMLSEIDVKLSQYQEGYFVIVAAETREGEGLLEMQEKLFELNNQINKKLEISEAYFSDVKFLFIGEEDVFKPLEEGRTLMEVYGKEAGSGRKQPAIYVFAREADGNQRLLNSMGLKPELASILNMIGKHRARKFATSMQF